MRPRAVLFDLDGTLVDSAPVIARALTQVRRARDAGPIDATRVRPWISLGADELVRRGLEFERLEKARASPLQRQPRRPASDRSAAGDLAAFRVALASQPTDPTCVYPGVRELLAALCEAGLALGVVTNKPERLSAKLLAELDLVHAFATIVGGDTTAHAKPHPAPVELALARLGVGASEAAFVGDSRIDAQAAAAVGLPFHLFERGYGAAECDAEVVTHRFSDYVRLAEHLGVRPPLAVR